MPQENPKPAETNEYPGYWRGKTPCWVMLGCSKFAYERCAAYLHPETPCWEHKVTCCEEVLRIPKDCQHCIVYKVNHYQDTMDTAAFY
jgi:hypothetical protein